MRMFYNNLKIIFFIFILSQSFLTYGSQQNNIYETSKDISPPKFQDIKNGMKELLDDMIELNSSLTSGKSKAIPNFEELSNKKLAICNELLDNYIRPLRRKGYNHPDFIILSKHIEEELSNTLSSILDPDYVPNLPSFVFYPGSSSVLIKSEKSKDNEIDKANKELGGRVFLKRSYYIERSNKEKIVSRREMITCSGECCFGEMVNDNDLKKYNWTNIE